MHIPEESKGKTRLKIPAPKVPQDEMLGGRGSQVRPTPLDPAYVLDLPHLWFCCVLLNDSGLFCVTVKAQSCTNYRARSCDFSSSAVSRGNSGPSDRKFTGFYRPGGRRREAPARSFRPVEMQAQGPAYILSGARRRFWHYGPERRRKRRGA